MSVRRCVGTLQWVSARVRRTPPRWDLRGVFPASGGDSCQVINILWLSCG